MSTYPLERNTSVPEQRKRKLLTFKGFIAIHYSTPGTKTLDKRKMQSLRNV